MTRQLADDHSDDVPPLLALSELRAEAERLIATLGHQVRRVRLRAGPNVIEVDWAPGAPEPVADLRPAVPAPQRGTEAAGKAVVRVLSPLVGTFYRAPSPGAPAFVEVGDVVRAGQQLAIVEAMKLLNPITAELPGRVTAINVDDAAMVEFEQVLFELEPLDDDVTASGTGAG